MIALSIASLLLLLNGWTMACFWRDKRCAVAGARRIPEARLLTLALIGGSPGALLARRLFRHKTRKQPFSALLYMIALGQCLVLAGWMLL